MINRQSYSEIISLIISHRRLHHTFTGNRCWPSINVFFFFFFLGKQEYLNRLSFFRSRISDSGHLDKTRLESMLIDNTYSHWLEIEIGHKFTGHQLIIDFQYKSINYRLITIFIDYQFYWLIDQFRIPSCRWLKWLQIPFAQC